MEAPFGDSNSNMLMPGHYPSTIAISNPGASISFISNTDDERDLSYDIRESSDKPEKNGSIDLFSEMTVAQVKTMAEEDLVPCGDIELAVTACKSEGSSPLKKDMEMEFPRLSKEVATPVEVSDGSILPTPNAHEHSAVTSLPMTSNPKNCDPQISSLDQSEDNIFDSPSVSYPSAIDSSYIPETPLTTTTDSGSTLNHTFLPSPAFTLRTPAQMPRPGLKPHAKRGRKRKNPLPTAVEPPIVKRAKTDLKRPAACRLCYEKHVGCERQSEGDACIACIKRDVACEPNDVKVIKGVRRKAVAVAAKSDHNQDVSEGPSDGGFQLLNSTGLSNKDSEEGTDANSSSDAPLPCFLSIHSIGPRTLLISDIATRAGAETTNSIERRLRASTALGMAVGSSDVELHNAKEVRDENTNISMPMTSEREAQAANILASLKQAQAKLLARETCTKYVQTIRDVLVAEERSGIRIQEALYKLEQLQCQLLWLTRGDD
ncbi:hypothetical protein ABW21_db0205544 [Orbilia brochopaga]|nr:hypothetical protein ABW21_db0205544 [Drechslerella brochopaga]